MSKVPLEGIKTGYRSNQKLSAQLEEIQEAFDNTVSRDGTSPNEMLADLDMNSQRILNLPAPTSMEEPLRLLDLDPDQIIYINEGGVGPSPTLPIVQAVVNGDTTHVPSGDAVYDHVTTAIAEAAGGGGGFAAIPLSQKGSANGVAPLDASGQVSAAYLPDGVPNGLATLDNTGKVPVSQLPVIPGSSQFATIEDYGGVGDDATDNITAFATAESAPFERIYLPEGVFLTSGTLSAFKKYYWGPGKIKLSGTGQVLPGRLSNLQDPLQPGGLGITGWFNGDNRNIDPEYFAINLPRKSLSEPYFESTAIPKNTWIYNYGGWSGATAHLAGSYGPGTTTVQIKGGTEGFTIGDDIGFLFDTTVGGNSVGVTYQDVVTVTGKTSNTVSFTPALTKSYTVNMVITHSPRTMNLHTYTYMRNFGGGDVYGHLVRVQQNYQPLSSHQHCFEASTVGQYGGDLVFNPGSSGTYGTGWESQYIDQGNDVAAIGQVDNYVRENDTGARGATWIGLLESSNGSKPADAAIVLAGKWRVGIDLTRLDATSNQQAAIQVATGHRVYFNSWVNPAGRSSVAGSAWGILWGNTPGDSYITHGIDGTSPYLDTFVGPYRTRLRQTGTFSFNGSMATATDFTAGQDIIATRDIAAIGKVRIGMLNSPVYLYWDGSNLRATKNAGASSVVII